MASKITPFCVFLALIFLASNFQQANAADPNTIIFGGDNSSPPFEWQESGRAKGFNIEIENSIAEIDSAKAEHRLGDWSVAIQALENGDIDALPMYVSEERKEKFLFTPAFLFVYHAIYATSNVKKPVSLGSLSGKRVAVEKSYYAYDKLLEEYPDIIVVPQDNTLSALKSLQQDSAEYALLTTSIAPQLIIDNRLDILEVSQPFWPVAYAFAVRKDRPELALRLENSLERLLASEKYHEIYRRWADKIEPNADTFADYLLTSTFILVPLIFIALLGYIWSWSLNRALNIKTTELKKELQLKKSTQLRLQYRAAHDQITGIAHHFHAVKEMNKILESSKNTDSIKELVIFSLGQTGERTRAFGHAAEEKFIQAFAERFKQIGFKVCGYLGRGVFTAFSDKDHFSSMLERLSQIIYVGKLAFYPDVRAGLSYWPNHAKNAQELSRKAEAAHALSYKHGTNICVFREEMEPSKEDMNIISEFRKGNCSQLYVMLQPQVNLNTGKIVGAEALVRWSSPELGEVPPWKFIPLLESAGLVGQVTIFMIDEVVKIASKLSQYNDDFKISINVSAQDFQRLDLPALFEASLQRHQVQANYIKLELTETSIAENTEQVREVLEKLSSMGIDTSIDDFGTGYSSLSYLSNYPITELKIDRTFIHDLPSNKKHRTIVQSTIALAFELGLIVVAEGAENLETIEILEANGCERVQGYVVSKPLTEENLFDFLRHHNNEWRYKT